MSRVNNARLGPRRIPLYGVQADPQGNRVQRREAARLAKRGVCWCKVDGAGKMLRSGCPSHHDKGGADA